MNQFLQRLRPPSRKRLFLLKDFSAEGTINLGCSYRFEPGEPAVAAGDGRVISIRSLLPDWEVTAGSLLAIQLTYEVTLDHGDGVWTVVHGLSSISVQTDQVVERGDILGYLLTDELFFQVKSLGTPSNPAKANRHFALQDGDHSIGRTGYIREAADRIPTVLASSARQVIVNGIHYFVNKLGQRSPILANIDFGGSTGTVTEGRGRLDFFRPAESSKWEVRAGVGGVDLIGNGFYDVLPGNGLYVKMSSADNSHGSWFGMLETITTFVFTTGHSFRLTWKAAGNQMYNRIDTLWFTAGTVATGSNTIQYDQGFQTRTVYFTGNGSKGQLAFRQSMPESTPCPYYGVLIKDVVLEDTTLGNVMPAGGLSFSNENTITTQLYSGSAVVGSAGDYWNVYVPVAFTQDYRACYCSYGYTDTPEVCFAYSTVPYIYLKNAQQQDTLIWLERVAPLVNNSGVTTTWNGLLQTWIGGYELSSAPYISVFRIHGLPPGTYDLYLYSTQMFGLSGSSYWVQVDAGSPVPGAIVPSGVPTWVAGQNYVLFSSLTVVYGSTVRIEAQGYLAGLQIQRT